MVRNARNTLVEQKKESPTVKKSKIEVVILGIDEGEGTVNDILQGVCKDLNVKEYKSQFCDKSRRRK